MKTHSLQALEKRTQLLIKKLNGSLTVEEMEILMQGTHNALLNEYLGTTTFYLSGIERERGLFKAKMNELEERNEILKSKISKTKKSIPLKKKKYILTKGGLLSKRKSIKPKEEEEEEEEITTQNILSTGPISIPSPTKGLIPKRDSTNNTKKD